MIEKIFAAEKIKTNSEFLRKANRGFESYISYFDFKPVKIYMQKDQ